MEYKEIRFSLSGLENDLIDYLIASLADIRFEGFQEEENSLIAYIPTNLFIAGNLSEILRDPAFSSAKITYTEKIIPETNWNKEWEKNYEPIIVDNICSVIAPFHEKQNTEYSLLIEPKMSFGTGHHETTRLMIRQIYYSDVLNKEILDIGCGTGILGIFALKKAALFVTAIDIDKWSYNNSKDNYAINNIDSDTYELIHSDVSGIPDKIYDIILANINRNILLADSICYAQHLKKGGYLILSGLLQSDRELMKDHCSSLGLIYISELKEGKWISLKFKK